MGILVAINDSDSRDFVARAFRESGSFVEEAKDAAEAFLLAKSENFRCIVVDRVLDSVCGISLLDFMRKNGIQTPVIVTSSSKSEEDAVLAFEAGADDYVRFPVATAELTARARAIGRRGRLAVEDGILKVSDLSLNRLTRQVQRKQEKILLQPRAYSILEMLMRNAGVIVTRTMLLETVWGYHFDPRSSVVETHISRLRDKVDKPFDVPLIQTIRGGGYMIGGPAVQAAV